MFKIKQDEREVYRFQFEKELKEKGIKIDVRLMEHLFGEDARFDCPFAVHHRYIKLPKKTKLQRFNHFWVYPLFVLSMPFTYVILGDYHIKRDSKLGLLLEQLLGEYR